MQNTKKTEEILKDWLEASADAMICVDENLRISLWNDSARAMFGYSREEVIGEPLTAIIPVEYEEVYEQILKIITDTGELSRKVFELEGLKQNGERFPIELYFCRTGLEGFFTVIIMRDVSERKRVEEELIRLNRELLALHETTTFIQKCDNLRETLSKIASQVVNGLRYEASLIGVINKNAMEVMTISNAGPDNEWQRIVGINVEGIKIPLNTHQNIALEACNKREIIVTHSLHDVLRPAVSQPLCNKLQKAVGIKTVASVPFVSDGKSLGSMLVISARDKITEVETSSLETFAKQAVIAIEKSLLAKNLKESKLKYRRIYV